MRFHVLFGSSYLLAEFECYCMIGLVAIRMIVFGAGDSLIHCGVTDPVLPSARVTAGKLPATRPRG